MPCAVLRRCWVSQDVDDPRGCGRSWPVVGIVRLIGGIEELRDGEGRDVVRHGEGRLLDVGSDADEVKPSPVLRDAVPVGAGDVVSDVVKGVGCVCWWCRESCYEARQMASFVEGFEARYVFDDSDLGPSLEQEIYRLSVYGGSRILKATLLADV